MRIFFVFNSNEFEKLIHENSLLNKQINVACKTVEENEGKNLELVREKEKAKLGDLISIDL